MITTDGLVASRDENNPGGAIKWKSVEELFQRTAGVITLTVNGREIRTTSEHPFYHVEKGWLHAGDLVSGDRLVSQYGEVVIVNKVEAGGEYEAVYNLRVADWHTYFVGSAEWGFDVWVHNASYPYYKRLKGPTGKGVQKVVQEHHAIPWDNKTYNHQKNALVKAAGVDLKSYALN